MLRSIELVAAGWEKCFWRETSAGSAGCAEVCDRAPIGWCRSARPDHRRGLELETSFVTEGFAAAQFGNSRSKFSVGREWLTRAALVFDLGSIVWNPRVYGH